MTHAVTVILGKRVFRHTWIILLALSHFLLAWSSKWQDAATWDEPYHILGGLSYWQHNDYRIQPENGNLPQRMVGLPLWILGDTAINTEAAAWKEPPPFEWASRLIVPSVEIGQRNLRLARAMTALLSTLLILTIYGFSRDLFGSRPALGALALAAFCPNLLAHGGLATSDSCFSLFFLLTLWMLGRTLRRASLGTVGGLCAGVAGAFLSKFSAPILLVLGLVYALVSLLLWRAARLKLHRRRLVFAQLRQRSLYLTGLLMACALTTYMAVWAAYGFRYRGFADDRATSQYYKFHSLHEATADGSLAGTVIRTFGDWKILPEAYLYGAMFVIRSSIRNAFFCGDYSEAGWWNYFPAALALKTPLSTQFVWLAAIMAFSLAAVLKRARNPRRVIVLKRGLAPLLLTFICGGALCLSSLNIGLRHALPVISLLLVLSGAAFSLMAPRYVRLAAGVAAFMTMLTAINAYPYYLPYFNTLVHAGKEHHFFIDSNFDWGQDLWRLKKLLTDGNLVAANEDIFINYFGPLKAFELSGIKAQPIGKMTPGLYGVSATCLMRVYSGGKWTSEQERRYGLVLRSFLVSQGLLDDAEIAARLAADKSGTLRRDAETAMKNLSSDRLMVYLSRRKPLAVAGKTIFLYRLTRDDLRQALLEPIALEE